jgi:hypothetical protein
LLGSCNSWTTTMETGVFSMWSMPRSYLENNQGDPFRAQLKVSLWREDYEVTWEAVLQGRLWRQNLSVWSWRISNARSHCQGMANEDSMLEKAQWVLWWFVECEVQWQHCNYL